MSVEKINCLESAPIVQNIEKKPEEEQVVQKTSGSTKDVVTVLSVLAAIGAAGVAIYKHKNAKKMIEEAEQAAKKKVEEAEEKAKKAAEETEKKIQEAVEKVKNEYEKNPTKTENPNPSAPKKKSSKKTKNNNIDTYDKPVPKTLEGKILDTELNKVDEDLMKPVKERQREIVVVPESKRLANFVEKTVKSIKKFFKKNPKTETTQTTATEHGKVKTAKETKSIKPTEDIEGTKPEEPIFFFDETGPEKILEGGIKDKELDVLDGRLVQRIREGKNGIISIPTGTKLADFVQKTTDKIKNRFNQYRNKFKKVILEPAKETKQVETQKPAEVLKPAETKVVEQTKPAENPIITENKNPIKQEPDKTPILKAKETAEEKVKNQIVDRILNIATDEQLITEYNRLKDRVAKKSVTDIESKVFLAIKGELFNHRNYRFTEKELNPVKRNGLGIKQSIEKLLKEKTNYKEQTEALINNPNTKEEHDAIQALYDTMAIKNFDDKGTREGLKALEKMEFAQRREKIASHSANQKWLKEQHDKKQQEYQELFDNYLKEVETNTEKSRSHHRQKETFFGKIKKWFGF